MRSNQFLDGVRCLIDRPAAFGKRSVKVRKLFANGIGEFGIGEPGNIVEVRLNPGRLFDVIGDDNARASFKLVTDFVEEAGLYQLVGAGLQISAANLGADREASDRYNLSFK